MTNFGIASYSKIVKTLKFIKFYLKSHLVFAWLIILLDNQF